MRGFGMVSIVSVISYLGTTTVVSIYSKSYLSVPLEVVTSEFPFTDYYTVWRSVDMFLRWQDRSEADLTLDFHKLISLKVSQDYVKFRY